MKLNKDVCRKCVNDFAKDKYGHDDDLGMSWNDRDDIEWKDEEIVECPYHPKRWLTVSINRTPRFCVKKFEHGIFAGMKK